jgi:broad specificity phosphatase PhoE
MKTLTFARHGQSVANAGGVSMAHDAIPLTELGQRQAQALADALTLRPEKILVSSYLRAQQTAQPFCARLGQAAEVHPLLHEFSTLDSARIAGLTGEQRWPYVQAYWNAADPLLRSGPDAETFVEFEARVGRFQAELAHLPHDTLFFGHGMWFALLIWRLLGFSAQDSAGMSAFRRFQQGLPMPNCAVYHLVQAKDGHWRVQGHEAIMRRMAQLAQPAP